MSVSAAGGAHLPPDAAAVLVDHLGDPALADAMEVLHAPLELIQRLLGRKPVASDLLLAPARVVVCVLGHDPSASGWHRQLAIRRSIPGSAAPEAPARELRSCPVQVRYG